ncbi:hypothetical protein ACFLU5_08940 [Bacteroidota bacterium]
MKRAFTILLTAFYLFLTAGLPITVHYCHGQIEEIRILSKAVNCCEDMEMPANSCCNIEINTDCCSNEYYFFQLDIDEEIVSPYTISKSLVATITKVLIDDSIDTFDVDHNTYQYRDLPPPKNQPIWLMNCNFSLYG